VSTSTQVLGICPQFDVCWPELTVSEHLLFYARCGACAAATAVASRTEIRIRRRLKGVVPSAEARVVQRVRDLVDLGEPDKDKPSAALSGGMRRRLSLAMALIGDPEVRARGRRFVFWGLTSVGLIRRSSSSMSLPLDSIPRRAATSGSLSSARRCACAHAGVRGGGGGPGIAPSCRDVIH
jgi:hypothetical protein